MAKLANQMALAYSITVTVSPQTIEYLLRYIKVKKSWFRNYFRKYRSKLNNLYTGGKTRAENVIGVFIGVDCREVSEDRVKAFFF